MRSPPQITEGAPGKVRALFAQPDQINVRRHSMPNAAGAKATGSRTWLLQRFKDAASEVLIRAHGLLFIRATNPARRQRHCAEMMRLIRARSGPQVERMDRALRLKVGLE